MKLTRKTSKEQATARAEKLQRIAAKQSNTAERQGSRPEVKAKSFWRTGAL